MKRYDTSSYFARRAPRYQAALRGCPLARVLDLLPYAAVVRAGGVLSKTGVRVCDAFGGTGFLARALRPAGFSFVVCDCCREMLAGASDLSEVELHITPDDFRSTLKLFGDGHFDMVLSHGGLHHVVEAANGTVDLTASGRRQRELALRLARLVRPGGILVIADIPHNEPPESQGKMQDGLLDAGYLAGLLGEIEAETVCRALALDLHTPLSFETIDCRIKERLFQYVPWAVPRRFFDEFVAGSTPMGHVAAYPDFASLDTALCDAGLSSWGCVNYRGPWLFRSSAEAGWFFREKFSVAEPLPLGGDSRTEQQMFEVISNLLGVRQVGEIMAVNWGITYAAYHREL